MLSSQRALCTNPVQRCPLPLTSRPNFRPCLHSFPKWHLRQPISITAYKREITSSEKSSEKSSLTLERSPRSQATEATSASYGADPESKENFWQAFSGRFLKGAAVIALVFAMGLMAVNPALAARSGGRMGGSSFSSARSSAGSSRFGGSSSFGGGSYSRSPMRSAPSVSLGVGTGLNSFGWFGPPAPFGGYGYPAPVSSGPGFGSIILWGILAAILFTAVTSYLDNGEGTSVGGERVTVAKVQVGLLGSARQMQKNLDRIAGRADTSSPSGLHYVLQETVVALLRNPDYCVYGQASTSKQRDLDAGESKFNELSLQERGKFKEETLVNVGGRTRRGSSSSGSRGGIQELIVVTILVAVDGALKMPKITSIEELRTALNRLGAIGQDRTLAVEVLWTPQDDGDYYTKDELFMDYPTLNTL